MSGKKIAGHAVSLGAIYTISEAQFNAKPKMDERVFQLNGKTVISIWSKKDVSTKAEKKVGTKKVVFKFSVCEWPGSDDGWIKLFTKSGTVKLAKGAFTVSEQSRHHDDPLARFREKNPHLKGTTI